jgi:hypothetical protein
VATSRWSSSLSNIEARIRRSLGIAGPINLTIDEQPKIQPVMIVDDATRPGAAASDLRGRRWALTHVGNNVQGGASGCLFIVSRVPQTTVGLGDKGGVIVDSLELSWRGAVTTQLIQTEVRYASSWETEPAVSIRDGWMVDPIGNQGSPGATVGSYEPSPMDAGGDAAVASGGFGVRIWEGTLISNGWQSVRIPLDLFLWPTAFLVIGNSVPLVAAQPAQMFANWRGRVF